MRPGARATHREPTKDKTEAGAKYTSRNGVAGRASAAHAHDAHQGSCLKPRHDTRFLASASTAITAAISRRRNAVPAVFRVASKTITSTTNLLSISTRQLRKPSIGASRVSP